MQSVSLDHASPTELQLFCLETNSGLQMANPRDDTTCRLCHGATEFAYRTLVLAKYEVSYYCCGQCGSLQTEWPYWLPETYGRAQLSIDPGSARRVLDSYVLVDV